MNTLLNALCDTGPDTVLFKSPKGAPLTAGYVRGLSHGLRERYAASGKPDLFIHVRSAASFCAAYLAASQLNRRLVLLPQAGHDYRQSVGATDSCFIGDQDIRDLPGPISAASTAAAAPHRPPRGADLTFFTSGTTGAAKPIEKPIAAIEREAAYWRTRFAGQIDHVASTVSHQHIYGLIFKVALPLLSAISCDDETTLTWPALLARITPRTLLVSGPAHLARLPADMPATSDLPKLILSSGGPLPEGGAQAVAEAFGTAPIEILGSTETGGVASRQFDGKSQLWTPLDGIELAQAPSGELMVTSPFHPEQPPFPMSDRVEIKQDGRFSLHGRLDSIVKIEGKRVSLARVEQVLKSHPDVSDAAVLVTETPGRTRLSALIILHDEARLRLSARGSFKLAKSIFADLSENLSAAETPKRWRFVADIQLNARSKRSPALMQRAFEGQRVLDLLQPSLIDVEGYTAAVTFQARADLPWFNGHFPGSPILPGLAQVHIAARIAEEIWSIQPASMNVSRLKFHRIIQPGNEVTVQVTCKPKAGKINFNFKTNADPVSTGTLG